MAEMTGDQRADMNAVLMQAIIAMHQEAKLQASTNNDQVAAHAATTIAAAINTLHDKVVHHSMSDVVRLMDVIARFAADAKDKLEARRVQENLP